MCDDARHGAVNGYIRIYNMTPTTTNNPLNTNPQPTIYVNLVRSGMTNSNSSNIGMFNDTFVFGI